MDILLFSTPIEKPDRRSFEMLKNRVPAHIAARAVIDRPGSLFAWALLARGLCQGFGFGTLPEAALAGGGKPYFPDYPEVQFSLSHTDGMAVCAIHDGTVGCDVERADRRVAALLMGKVLTAGEKAVLDGRPDMEEAFIKIWTLKEAALKKSGLGLAGGISTVDLSAYLRGDEKNGTDGDYFSLLQLRGHVISVCGGRPVREVVEVCL